MFITIGNRHEDIIQGLSHIFLEGVFHNSGEEQEESNITFFDCANLMLGILHKHREIAFKLFNPDIVDHFTETLRRATSLDTGGLLIIEKLKESQFKRVRVGQAEFFGQGTKGFTGDSSHFSEMVTNCLL